MCGTSSASRFSRCRSAHRGASGRCRGIANHRGRAETDQWLVPNSAPLTAVACRACRRSICRDHRTSYRSQSRAPVLVARRAPGVGDANRTDDGWLERAGSAFWLRMTHRNRRKTRQLEVGTSFLAWENSMMAVRRSRNWNTRSLPAGAIRRNIPTLGTRPFPVVGLLPGVDDLPGG